MPITKLCKIAAQEQRICPASLPTYSGAYPPINSGRIKSARAAIKSVIPADMHPFWEEKREEKGRKEFYPFDLLIFKVDIYPIPEHMHPVWR